MDYDYKNRLVQFRDTSEGNSWQSVTYDARGNVTRNGDLSLGAVNLTYDRANQPTALSGSATGTFTYDGHNRRVKQVINGETTYSIYGLEGALLFRDNATANDRTIYVHLAGMTVARAWTCWTTVYLHTDHLGSPVAATDASANLQWREDYTPYGEARQTPWPNDDQSGFTGHIHDADTGLTYMQARYYDPVIGRFLSEDPVGFAQGGAGYFNRYAYVMNDPVNNTDPTGEACIPCIGFLVGVVGDVAVQVVQNGGFRDIDPGQALRAGAIGAVSGGLSSLGKSLVSQAAQAGVKTFTVSAVNAGRNATIASGATIAEAVNAGATGNEVLSSAAIDLATGKIGGAVLSEIEGGDAVVRETGEHLSDVAGGMMRGFSDAQQQQHLSNDQSYLSGQVELQEYKSNSCQISGFGDC